VIAWVLTSVVPRLPTRLHPSQGHLVERLSPEIRSALRRDGLEPDPELLAAAPVRQVRLPLGSRGWLVTGYDEVRAVLADARSFSNDFGHVIGRPGVGQELDPGGLGVSDPPYHTELRRLLAPEFTARRLASRLPRIEQIVAAQLDALERESGADGRVDLVAHFARPVPWLVMCDLLGIGEDDRAVLYGLAGDRFDVGGGVIGSLTEMTAWNEQLRHLVAQARTDPRPGLLARLVASAGDELGDVRLAGVVDGLIVGGLETTASMLALGVLVALRDPEVRTSLADPSTPARPLVEELLRRLSVVQVPFPRFARADVRLGEAVVREGDVVICSISAANHDPGARAAGHLAFGHGLHRCVGAELARLELGTALPALHRRFPRLRLAVPDQDLAFHDHSVVFGVRELPVALG
jgi:cytochrome P450